MERCKHCKVPYLFLAPVRDIEGFTHCPSCLKATPTSNVRVLKEPVHVRCRTCHANNLVEPVMLSNSESDLICGWPTCGKSLCELEVGLSLLFSRETPMIIAAPVEAKKKTVRKSRKSTAEDKSNNDHGDNKRGGGVGAGGRKPKPRKTAARSLTNRKQTPAAATSVSDTAGAHAGAGAGSGSKDSLSLTIASSMLMASDDEDQDYRSDLGGQDNNDDVDMTSSEHDNKTLNKSFKSSDDHVQDDDDRPQGIRHDNDDDDEDSEPPRERKGAGLGNGSKGGSNNSKSAARRLSSSGRERIMAGDKRMHKDSGYMIFCQMQRSESKKSPLDPLKSMPMTEQTGVLAAKWRAMSPEQQSVYEKMATPKEITVRTKKVKAGSDDAHLVHAIEGAEAKVGGCTKADTQALASKFNVSVHKVRSHLGYVRSGKYVIS